VTGVPIPRLPAGTSGGSAILSGEKSNEENSGKDSVKFDPDKNSSWIAPSTSRCTNSVSLVESELATNTLSISQHTCANGTSGVQELVCDASCPSG